MSKWIKSEPDDGDIRLSYVVRLQRDPLAHEQLRRIKVRGGYSAIVRSLLNHAAKSGDLQRLVDQVNAGLETETQVRPAAGPVHKPIDAATPDQHTLERMSRLNRF